MTYTHIVKRASGYVAGWFEGEPPAEFVAECNANVPSDPAHVEEIPAWPAELAGQAAEAELAELDKGGQPYMVPREGVTHQMAQAIARSKHPSRVLANTNGYRYGRFEELYNGTVIVTMMGSHIATFRRSGVQLSSCGYRTQSTTEALSNLVSGGYFYTDKGVIYFSAYESTGCCPDCGGTHRTGQPFRDGQAFSYRQGARI